MVEALKKGKREALSNAASLADGIAVKMPGEKTFEYCRKYVDEIVTVTDDEIASAILTLMEQQKLVSEGAGATPVAALLAGKIDIKGKKTVCLISGGNIDVTILSRVITRGLMMQSRLVELEIEVFDRPKQLSQVSQLVADLGANVFNVEHDRKTDSIDLKHCILRLGLETRDRAHIDEVVTAIREHGWRCKEL